MGQYTSYFLYEKYEKRGEQEAIPAYPNVYSIDADGTMQKVIKLEDDQQCGYDPPTDPIYKWVNIPITQDYICEDCEIIAIYRWVNMDASVDYYCEGTTKYYKQKKQVSYDSGTTWTDVVPAEYQKGEVAETESTDCGYIPPQPEPMYRWVNLDPSVDYYCSGTTKMYKQQKEQSSDSGETWTPVVPSEFRMGEPYQTESTDCGYVPPTNAKVSLYFGDSLGYSAECDSTHTVTSADTYHSTYTGFTRAEIGECVNTIGVESFFRLSGLTSVSFPSTLSTIESNAFYMCERISNVEIPSNVRTIGSGAFHYCSSLTNVVIPNGVTSIGAAIGVEPDLDGYNYGTFGICGSLTSVTIPQSVVALNENKTNQFECCRSLTRITVDSNNSAYCDISGVLFNKSQTNLIAYPNMKSTTYTIPNSVMTINRGAFSCCNNLTSITIPNGVSSIGVKAFEHCENLSQITIPSSVTNIGERAFNGCRMATNISIPPSVSSIGIGAFGNCISLTSIEIPSGITSIANSCFSYCSGLTSVNIPDNITSIGIYSFGVCSSLQNVTISSSITNIDESAFENCSGLTSVTVNATTPPTLGINAFYNTNNCQILVPSQSVSAYKSATNWSTYADRIQAIS